MIVGTYILDKASVNWLVPPELLKNDVKTSTCPCISFTVNKCLLQLTFDAEESEKGLGFFCNILHYHWSCQQDINSPKTATEPIELQRGITNAPLSVASKPLSLFTKPLKSLQLSQNIYYTVKTEKHSTFGNFYFPLLKIWEPVGLFKAA